MSGEISEREKVVFSIGTAVRYTGELPFGYFSREGEIVGLTPDASGDTVCTVAFDDGRKADILASNLECA